VTGDEFAEAMFAGLEGVEPPAYPLVVEIPEGDCLEVFLTAEDYYGQWIDHDLTVYRSFESGRVVGAVFSGVRGRGI
jgi:hypothetical protein